MEFATLIQTRQSIRAFAPQVVSEEKVQAILQAVLTAPSAGNLQAYRVYVVQDKKLQQALVKDAMGQAFIAEAACVLVFCADPSQNAERYKQRGETLYAVQDATIACTFAMLAAANEGLGSVWVGAFDETAVAHTLSIPANLRPVALLPIGYAAEEPARRPRRFLSSLVHFVNQAD